MREDWKLEPFRDRCRQIRACLSGFNELGVNRFDVGVGHWNPDGSKGAFWSRAAEAGFFREDVASKVGWFGFKNAHGGDIYIRPHGPLAWAMVFIDDLTEQVARDVAEKYKALIVETSAHNFQAWVGTDIRVTTVERHEVQRVLVQRLHRCSDVHAGDPRSTSGNKFGRLPGFKTWKPGRDNVWVNLVALPSNSGLLLPVDRLLAQARVPSLPAPRGAGVVLQPRIERVNDLGTTSRAGRESVGAKRVGRVESAPDTSESAREFGWVCGMVRSGRLSDQEILRRLIGKAASRVRRQSPGEPERYAEVTLRNAKAAIAAEGGVSSPTGCR